MYLGQRVREPAGLKWNADNAKHVRRQLDKIIIDIESGTFSFAEVFPESKNKDHFSDLEHQLLERRKTPEQVLFKEHVWIAHINTIGNQK
jgi:hypothetical protein